MTELTMSLCPKCTRKNADAIEKNKEVAQALLRVARVAERMWNHTYATQKEYHDDMDEFIEALKEVEHLL